MHGTRASGTGIWRMDSTEEFRSVDPSSIGPTGALILPKLFRRCTDYLTSVKRGFDGTLVDWRWANNDSNRLEDDRIVVEDRWETNLSQIIEHRNNRIAMKVDPNDVVYVEKESRPAAIISPQPFLDSSSPRPSQRHAGRPAWVSSGGCCRPTKEAPA